MDDSDMLDDGGGGGRLPADMGRPLSEPAVILLFYS